MTERRAGLALILLVFVAYHANLRQVSTDTAASRLVPLSLLRDGDFALDELASSPILDIRRGEPIPYYLSERNGHLYDAYPPVGPILAIPFYAVPLALGWQRDPELLANLCSKIAASAMATASVWIVWNVLRRLGHQKRDAWLVAAVYGLGTSVWSTASQGLWTHTPAILLFAAAMWAFLAGHLGWSLAAIAIGAWARPVLTIALPVALLLGLDWHRSPAVVFREALRASRGAVVVLLFAATYNTHVSGHVLGAAEARNAYWNGVFQVASMWDGRLLEGALGLAICPSRGVLIYSPVVLLAVVGALRAWKGVPAPDGARCVSLLRMASVVCGAAYLAYAKYLVWWGGHAFGPRYLVDVMPFAALLMAAGLESALTSTRRYVVPVLAGYSIAIQAVGAFCWPSPLEGPIDRRYYERLWSPNNQIVKCIRSGPVLDKTARHALGAIGFRLAPPPRRRPSAPSNGGAYPPPPVIEADSGTATSADVAAVR